MTQTQPQKTGSGTGYDVARSLGACAISARQFKPGEKFMAALRETSIGFERVDVSMESWEQLDKAGVLAFWKTVMPQVQQKKKLFVDDQVLCELFERLADVEEPAKLNFRFVLGLILMRKRLIIYEGSRPEGETEIWRVRLKGKEEMMDLLNPRLDESQMKDVSDQLAEILAGE